MNKTEPLLRNGARYIGRFGGALHYWAWRNWMVPGAWIVTTGTLSDPIEKHVVVARGTSDDILRELTELGARLDK